MFVEAAVRLEDSAHFAEDGGLNAGCIWGGFGPCLSDREAAKHGLEKGV